MGKKHLTIVAGTTMAIFSLFACFTGAYAWFENQRNVSYEMGMFEISSMDASISEVTLYKFCYKADESGELNYLEPQLGSVQSFTYDATRNKFGKYVEDPETHQSVWTPVSTMNLYDPLDGFVTGEGLAGLNCNAIFEITISTSTLADYSFQVSAVKNGTTEADIEPNQILLSTCVDFDYYLPNDLVDSGESTFWASTTYWPTSYLDSRPTAGSLEELYYKISYLSNQDDVTHDNFYSQPGASHINIGSPRSVSFDSNGLTKVYVNVNYSPNQLKQYEDTKKIDPNYTGATILAVYDFLLQIS